MFFRPRFLLVISLLLLLATTVTASASDRYLWIVSSDDTTYSFDSQTIKFLKKYDETVNYSVIEVWLKCEFNEDGKERMKNKYNYIKGIESISYTLEKRIYDIKNHKTMFLTEIVYDETGNVLDVYKNKYANWEDIVPGSYGEIIEFIIGLYSNNKTNRNYMEQRSK